MSLGIEIGLELINGLVEVLAHLHAEKIGEDGAVEALDESVHPGRSDFGPAMPDAVEIEIEFAAMSHGATEFAVVVGQDRFHRQVEVTVEGQNVIMEDAHRCIRLLGDVQEAEGVHDRVEAGLAQSI